MNDVRNMNLGSEEIDFDTRKTIYYARKGLAQYLPSFFAPRTAFEVTLLSWPRLCLDYKFAISSSKWKEMLPNISASNQRYITLSASNNLITMSWTKEIF